MFINIDISDFAIFDSGALPSLPFPLLDSMVWNHGGECPVCSSQQAVGWAGGPINTLNGNLSYEETDLAIPVSGGSLEFRRSYASQTVDTYTSLMGFGWTHNYDMRLITSGTALPDTIEFQGPGGSRLPFIVDDTDPNNPTFDAYPGVTAELVYIPSGQIRYELTAFNQYIYRFRADGRIVEQEDPYGHRIGFDYNPQNQDELIKVKSLENPNLYLAFTYYSGSDRLQFVTDHTGREFEFIYHPTTGDLWKVIDPLGTTTYNYQGSTHLLTEVIDPSGRIVEKTYYDELGRAYEQENGAGQTLVEIEYAVSATNGITENEVIENGVTTIHGYDDRRTYVESTPVCTGDAGCGETTAVNHDNNFKADFVQDANGNPPTLLEWSDGGSNLQTVTNGLNQPTSMTYNETNNLTDLVDALDNHTEYKYEDTNFPTFMTEMIDALDHSTVYVPTTTADGIPGLLKSVEDPNGRVTTYEYNDYGLLIEQVVAADTADAMTTSYEYDTLGRLIITTRTSATESHKSLNVYNPGDQLIATIENWTGSDPAAWQDQCIIPPTKADENICTQYTYDPAGRLTATTDALGRVNLTFYDMAGRVNITVNNWNGASFTDPLLHICNFASPNPEYNICSVTEYDEYGRVYRTTNSLGHQTVTEYDSLGRVSRTIVNWVDGVFNTAEPDRDLITEYEYDAVGNVLVVTDPLGHQTRTFYDELNRVKGTVENWDGTFGTTDLEEECNIFATEQPTQEGNICTLYEYDAVGNKIVVTNALMQRTRTFYDELNRVEGVIENWDGTADLSDCVLLPGNTDEENICTFYGYDDAGQQITTTNALNQTTLTVYDAAGRPFLTVANWDGTTEIENATHCDFPPTEPDVNVCTLTTYDGLGRRVSTKDPLGNVTEYEYDGLGRLVTTTRYLGPFVVTNHTVYDALGNRLSSTNAEGHTTTYTYDSLNRLIQTTTPEGVVTGQSYNAAGWLLTSTDGLNHSTIMGYDLMGRRTSVTDPEDNTTLTYYDALGNQTATVDAEGVRTRYDYDGLNRLTAVTENDILGTDPSNETDILTQYQYDALGNRVVITNALGFTSSHTLYDDLNRPILVRDGLGNETQTAYNALGLRTVITDANGAVATYSYDGLNRVTVQDYLADGESSENVYDAAGNRVAMFYKEQETIYQYDDLYRLTAVMDPFDAAVVYEYDRVGNRTELTYPDGKQVVYTYDGDNRLIAVQSLWDGGITNYHYDEAGRLTTAELPNGVVTFYTYDDANRLIELQHLDSTTGETIARYEYELDKVGNRTAVTETMRLPATPGGQASLPFGVSSADDAPLTAEDAVAAIQPPDISLDKDHLSRPPVQEPPPPPTPPAQLPGSGVYTTTTPLPLVEGEDLPFDPAAVVEQARNQLQTEPDGDAFIERPAHEARIDTDGTLIFAPVISDTDLLTATLDPSTSLTVSLELARLTVGTDNLSITPTPGEQEVDENVASLPRGPELVEEFVARDGGIEQRWQLLSPPPENGNLTLVVEATTALAVTVDGDGFVFYAPTGEGETIAVARYGRALAIDANGDQRWADLSFTQIQPAPDGRHRYRLQMTIPADWLAAAQYPLLIDPLLSNLVRLEQTAPANDQSVPQVAYNPDLDEFLLVWQDNRNSSTTGWDIYAQRVNGEGALLDENFIISNANYQQSNPRIAYGGGVYLVAWKHFTSVAAFDTYGAIVSGSGSILANNIQIAAATGGYDQEAPSYIIYNSTSNQFLVLYQTLANSWANVWGRHVAPDGTMSSAIQITSQASNHEDSAVGAYSSQTNSYLVAWESYTGSNRKVYGQRLTSSGSPTGSVIDMSTGSGDERYIDMLYLAGINRFVLVWRDNRNNATRSYDIYGQQVDPDGTLAGSNFEISMATVEESFPRLALSPATGGALVLWQTNNGGSAGYDLYGRLLDSNGLVAGDTLALETANAHQQRPVLAANSEGDMLVAWYDARNGNLDIFTSMKLADGGWGGAGMAHPAPGAQEKPQIAYNPDDDEYLVVWQDYRSSNNWDVYGQRVDGDGSLLGTNITIDTTVTKHQLRPQVAYGANEYLVAWQHYTDNNNTTYDVYGRVVNRNGSFATNAFVIANYSGIVAFQESPTDIAYNSTANQFLVVWETESTASSGAKDIWARHVSPSGTVGSYIQVATLSSRNETAATATYNAENDQYLVIWDSLDKGAEIEDVIGRRVSGSGTVTTGDNILISTTIAETALPDVVYQPNSDRYIVVWQQEGNVYSRGVLPNGTIAGGLVTITNTSQLETNPRLAGDGQSLLAVWQRQNNGSGYDLYARPLDASGQPNGEPFTIQEDIGNQQNPAIAYSTNQRYQLAWQDDATGPWDLFTASLDRSYQVTHIQYEYDPLHRLVRADYDGDFNGKYTYAYDAVGNRTTYTTTITNTTVIAYAYDAANRLLESREAGGDVTVYQWDDAGRLLGTAVDSVNGRTYTYDQRGNLTSALVDNLLTTFIYDGDGHRLQMSVGSEVTTYTLDYAGGFRVLLEEGGAFAKTKHYLYGLECIGELVDADEPESEWRYYHQDGNHLVRQTTNIAATVTLAWTYSPEGAIVLGEEGPVTHLGCEGNTTYDFSTGLIFKNSRYFDPNTGIWITLSGMVVWNGWQARPQNRRQRKRSKKWLLLLFIFLIVVYCQRS